MWEETKSENILKQWLQAENEKAWNKYINELKEKQENKEQEFHF